MEICYYKTRKLRMFI